MSGNTLAHGAYDALQQQLAGSRTQGSVTFDGTTTAMSSEQSVAVPADKNLQLLVSGGDLWPVSQTLRINPANQDECQYVGDVDEGARSLFSCRLGGGEWKHTFYANLTLFRDASQRRASAGLNPLPNYPWDVLAFPGPRILSDNQSAVFVNRFAASVARGVAGYDRSVSLYPGSSNGQLCYLMTPDSSARPRLAAVYVPSGIEWDKPVPLVTFLTPYTHKKAGNYPWSTDFNAMLDNYLINGGKRLLAQVNSSGRKCVFVFPIPLPHGFYDAVHQAADMRRYLLEIVYWLQRKIGQQRLPQPALGRCAVAAFSAGGNAMRHLLQSAAGGGFDELKEVYGLDVVNAAGGYPAFRKALAAWWKDGRRVRFYETDHAGNAWAGLGPSFKLQPSGNSVGGALEYQGKDATFAWLPTTFWQAVWTEDPSTERSVLGHFPPDGDHNPVQPIHDSVHQVIPAFFLQHALANSGFENR